ncbi:MAG: hypothetical protein IKY34_03275 [Ruminiclostridium sp.]|nr:hypothetical protein [Ruminiclostridium sp.]
MKRTKRILSVAVCCVAIVSLLASCGEKSCEHEFYLSDYVAPTATENGHNDYACLNCGTTYQEAIPATGEAPPGVVGDDIESTEPEEDVSRAISLLSLPVYSSNGTSVSYEADIEDIDGWRHKDCYQICCSHSETSPNFRRWELAGNYSEVSGTIYMRQGNSCSYWLEFYDGEQLIYTTPRLSSSTTSVDFSFDVTGVEYLTMYSWVDGSNGCWIIADPINITT